MGDARQHAKIIVRKVERGEQQEPSTSACLAAIPIGQWAGSSTQEKMEMYLNFTAAGHFPEHSPLEQRPCPSAIPKGEPSEEELSRKAAAKIAFDEQWQRRKEAEAEAEQMRQLCAKEGAMRDEEVQRQIAEGNQAACKLREARRRGAGCATSAAPRATPAPPGVGFKTREEEEEEELGTKSMSKGEKQKARRHRVQEQKQARAADDERRALIRRHPKLLQPAVDGQEGGLGEQTGASNQEHIRLGAREGKLVDAIVLEPSLDIASQALFECTAKARSGKSRKGLTLPLQTFHQVFDECDEQPSDIQDASVEQTCAIPLGMLTENDFQTWAQNVLL